MARIKLRVKFKLGVRGKILIFLFLHNVTLASALKKYLHMTCFGFTLNLGLKILNLDMRFELNATIVKCKQFTSLSLHLYVSMLTLNSQNLCA